MAKPYYPPGELGSDWADQTLEGKHAGWLLEDEAAKIDWSKYLVEHPIDREWLTLPRIEYTPQHITIPDPWALVNGQWRTERDLWHGTRSWQAPDGTLLAVPDDHIPLELEDGTIYAWMEEWDV